MAAKESKEKIPITTSAELTHHLELLATSLSIPETEDTWHKILSSLAIFTACIRGGACKHPALFLAHFRDANISYLLCSAIASERTRLSGTALELMGASSRLGTGWDPLVGIYVPCMIKLLGRANKVYVTRAATTLRSLVRNTRCLSILAHLHSGMSDKSVSLRLGCAEIVLCALGGNPDKDVDNINSPVVVEGLERRLGDVDGVLKLGGGDKDAKVRGICKRIWEIYKREFPEKADAFAKPLTPNLKRYLSIPKDFAALPFSLSSSTTSKPPSTSTTQSLGRGAPPTSTKTAPTHQRHATDPNPSRPPTSRSAHVLSSSTSHAPPANETAVASAPIRSAGRVASVSAPKSAPATMRVAAGRRPIPGGGGNKELASSVLEGVGNAGTTGPRPGRATPSAGSTSTTTQAQHSKIHSATSSASAAHNLPARTAARNPLTAADTNTLSCSTSAKSSLAHKPVASAAITEVARHISGTAARPIERSSTTTVRLASRAVSVNCATAAGRVAQSSNAVVPTSVDGGAKLKPARRAPPSSTTTATKPTAGRAAKPKRVPPAPLPPVPMGGKENFAKAMVEVNEAARVPLPESKSSTAPASAPASAPTSGPNSSKPASQPAQSSRPQTSRSVSATNHSLTVAVPSRKNKAPPSISAASSASEVPAAKRFKPSRAVSASAAVPAVAGRSAVGAAKGGKGPGRDKGVKAVGEVKVKAVEAEVKPKDETTVKRQTETGNNAKLPQAQAAVRVGKVDLGKCDPMRVVGTGVAATSANGEG